MNKKIKRFFSFIVLGLIITTAAMVHIKCSSGTSGENGIEGTHPPLGYHNFLGNIT